MTYKSQKIAYYFFATCMLLFSLQIIYGFIMGFAHMGYDVLHDFIPFNTARAVHTNLLVVWLLAGFMGAAYYIIPEESGVELHSPLLGWVQLASLVVVGVIAIVGFHFNWWEGRKFLEIPRPLDYLVVVNVLVFLYNIGMTVWKGPRKSSTAIVLYMGLLSAALLYLPGMIHFSHQTMDSYFRWWVVHLWVEGVWELIMGSILAYLLIKLTGVDREVIEKWLYVIVGLTFLSGILGTGHHYYFIGTPSYWLWIGGLFSALEPLAFLAMALFAVAMYRRSGRKHPNQIALFWSIGCAIMSFVGAGSIDFLEMAERSSNRALKLVNDLLQFARAGANADNKGASFVDDVLKRIEETFMIQSQKLGVNLTIDYDDRCSVPCSEGVLFSILENLVSNALKYIGNPNGGSIRVRSKTNAQFVRISVEDTGPGIPTEAHDAIFEPFKRLDNKGDGFGIGLATVKRLVEACGGSIGLDSQFGKGACFWVEFRLSDSKV